MIGKTIADNSGALATFITAIGVGSIVAAWISHRNTISGHRQNWINSLRDDIALFLEKLTSSGASFYNIYYPDLTGSELEHQRIKVTQEALFVFFRIKLRLNMSEKLHRQLSESLERLVVIAPVALTDDSLEDALSISQRLLKREWKVAKSLSLWP